MINSLLISSTKKSSGKTIISIGLSGLFNDIGYKVRTFKKGPDFIDPTWLSLASNKGAIPLVMPSQSITIKTSLFSKPAITWISTQ